MRTIGICPIFREQVLKYMTAVFNEWNVGIPCAVRNCLWQSTHNDCNSGPLQFAGTMHQRFINWTDLLVEATAAIPVVLHAIFHIPVMGGKSKGLMKL
jgi:hypothetical protein